MSQTPFNAYSASVEFDPLEGADLTGSLEEQQDKLIQSLKERNRQQFEYEMAAAKQKDQRLQKLASLSQTLAQAFAPQIQARKDRLFAEGQNEYYNLSAQGKQEIIDEVNQQQQNENTFHASNVQMVNQAVVNGDMSPMTANVVKGMSKNKRRGFYAAFLSDKATQWPMFLKQGRSELRIAVVDPISNEVVEKTYDELGHNDFGNKKLLDAEIRRIFLQDVQDPDIQPLATKYLYDSMNRHDERVANEDMKKFEEVEEANEKAERKDEMVTSIMNRNSFDLAESIRTRGIEINSIPGAKAEYAQELIGLLESNSIDPEDLAAMLNSTVDISGTEMTLISYLGTAGFELENKLNESQQEFIKKEVEWGEYQGEAYIDNVEKTFNSLGRPPNEDELKVAIEGWNLDWGPVPQKLKSIITREDKDDKDTTSHIDFLIDKGQRVPQYLVNSINDSNIQAQYQGRADNHNSRVPGGNLTTARDRHIRAVVRESLDLTIGDEDTGSTQFLNQFYKGQEIYQEAYVKQLELTKDENAAHKAGISAVSTEFQVDLTGEPAEFDKVEIFQDAEKERQKYISNQEKKTSDALLWLDGNNSDFTSGIITGTVNDLKKIHEQNEQGIDPQIPAIFYKIADRYKNYGPVDIINAQLQLRGLPPIKRPDEETNIDPKVLRLRNYKSTPRRLIRSENMSKNYNTDKEVLLAGL